MGKILGDLAKALFSSIAEGILSYLSDLRKEGQLKKEGALEAQQALTAENLDVIKRAREIDSIRSTDLRSAINRL